MASAIWTLGPALGLQTAEAVAANTESALAIFSATAEPTKLMIESGNNQAVYLARALAPFVVTVTSLAGVPLGNKEVTWTVTKGNVLLENCWCTSYHSSTDPSGRASAQMILNATPEAIEVTVTAEGVSEPVVFSATAVAPPVVLHYSGTSWSVAVADSTNEVTMTSMFASLSPLFAVGSICNQPFVMQLVGTTWTGVPKACPSAAAQPASGSIVSISPSDVFAIVTRFFNTGRPGTVTDTTDVVRFDGQSITRVHRDTIASGVLELYGLAVRSTQELFAVGVSGYVVRFDGTTWTTTKTDTPHTLTSVWADSNTPVAFAVGWGGTIELYDGANWHLHTSGTIQTLRGVWGTSPSDVFAVGDKGTILHYDGNSWSPQTSGTSQSLNVVWGTSPTAVFAAGDNGTVLRYDGTSWKAETLPFGFNFLKMWGVSASDVYAVGSH